jgi:hypothetical protein
MPSLIEINPAQLHPENPSLLRKRVNILVSHHLPIIHVRAREGKEKTPQQ